jgi:hypothetical protein
LGGGSSAEAEANAGLLAFDVKGDAGNPINKYAVLEEETNTWRQ